jgi:hypothetical protein
MSNTSPFQLPNPTLSAKQRQRFKSLRDEVSAALQDEASQSLAIAKAHKQVNDLAAEIAELEDNLNPSDASAVAALNSKRTQHEILSRRLPAPPVSPGPRDEPEGVEPLAVLRAELGAFFKSYLEEQILRFGQILAPLFAGRGAKDAAADATWWVKTAPLLFMVSERYVVNLGDARSNWFSPESVLTLVDKLLSGKNPFAATAKRSEDRAKATLQVQRQAAS